jgi:hypothetical protein
MVLPVSLNPQDMFAYLKSLLQKASALPPKLKTNLVIRLVRCAVLCGKADELYKGAIIHDLYQHNDRVYQLPLLMLIAHTHAISTDPIFSGDIRSDTILLYYIGLNSLLSSQFGNADVELVHAW